MIVENSDAGSTTSSESAAETTGSAPETSSSEISTDVPEGTDATPPPAYSPNLKFKVHDKELEFEPWMKDAIKNAEAEKKARELHEKAYGLDYVKQDRSQLRDRLKGIETEYRQQSQGIQQLTGMIQKKDFDSFFDAVNIQEDDVLRYALQIAQRRQNPQLLQQHQQERQYKQQLGQAHSAQEQLQEQYAQVAVQAKTFEMNQVLSRPDVHAAREAFDARVGRPGAFEEEVIKRGQYHHYMSGSDVSAEQAVSEVLHLIGPVAASQQPQAPVIQTPGVQQTPGQQQVVAPAPKPVIPNIQGRGTSPTKKVPTSLEDIKRIRDDMIRAESA